MTTPLTLIRAHSMPKHVREAVRAFDRGEASDDLVSILLQIESLLFEDEGDEAEELISLISEVIQ